MSGLPGRAAAQKIYKPGFGLGDEIRGKAPHVHRNDRIRGQVHPGLAAVFRVMDTAIISFNAGALRYRVKISVSICYADTTADGTVGADRVAQKIPHHHPRIFRAGVPGAQVIVDQLKAGAAVIIIGIDDSERRINRIGSRQNGMAVPHGLMRPAGTVKPSGRISSS